MDDTSIHFPIQKKQGLLVLLFCIEKWMIVSSILFYLKIEKARPEGLAFIDSRII